MFEVPSAAHSVWKTEPTRLDPNAPVFVPQNQSTPQEQVVVDGGGEDHPWFNDFFAPSREACGGEREGVLGRPPKVSLIEWTLATGKVDQHPDSGGGVWSYLFPEECRACDWDGTNRNEADASSNTVFSPSRNVDDVVNLSGSGWRAKNSQGWQPMSAAMLRAVPKASREREKLVMDESSRRQLCEQMEDAWNCTFDSAEPDESGPDEYAKWNTAGRAGEEATQTTYLKCGGYSGPKAGWVFKLGGLGLGYYQDGISEKRHVDLFKAMWPNFDAEPVVLQLDKCVHSEIVGDLRKATLADDSVNKARADERKAKRAKSRYSVSKAHGDAVMAKQTTTMDTSHRDVGLWAVDSANPNAWGGG